MVDSGSINGVPATASHYLLTDILRKQMGFQGVVISDYQDVPALQTAYHMHAGLGRCDRQGRERRRGHEHAGLRR